MNNLIILDDDVFLTEDLDFIFSRKGYNVTCFNKPDQFLDALEQGLDNSFFILDIMMRKGDRYDYSSKETGEYIYQKILSKYPHSKVIIISAKDLSEIDLDLNENSHFILKPIAPEASDIQEYLDD